MQKTLVPMKIPALSVNLTNVKFLCSGKKYMNCATKWGM